MSDFNERAFKEDGQWLENHYSCDCGEEWSDQWACACDDDCPACGVTCSPTDSDDLTDDILEEHPHLARYAAGRRRFMSARTATGGAVWPTWPASTLTFQTSPKGLALARPAPPVSARPAAPSPTRQANQPRHPRGQSASADSLPQLRQPQFQPDPQRAPARELSCL